MNKNKKKKNYSKKSRQDDEYEDLKNSNNNEEYIIKNYDLTRYKIIIGILIFIIIILIICICYQIYKDQSSNEIIPSVKDQDDLTKDKGNGEENKDNKDENKEENKDENKEENKDENKEENKDENKGENKEENKEENKAQISTQAPGPKRKIYVQYMDFWPAFKLERFDVHRILLEKYDVVQSDNPDYVIFGEFGGKNYGIENRINCIKLFLSIENRSPNFDNTDYAIGIHYIDKGDRYFRKPTETFQLSAIQTVYNVTQVKNIDIKSKKFCAWVVSNGGGSERNKFFDKLSQYKVVDSGGSFRNNVGGPVEDKLEFLSHYKFSICFENSKTQGYISEKLVDGFEAGTIPIYFGDDTILELLNNKSYIHVRDESEFDEKIELIKKIDNNDTLYNEMLREKIVIDDTRYEREKQKYKDFIYHIIEQDKEKAKRFERSSSNK